MDWYTEDNRLVVFSDLKQNWKLEDYYNYITDGFTVEGKNQSSFVVPKQKSPKIAINSNYTISTVNRSDRRRLFFVPISQFYGVLADTKGLTPNDVHGQWLLSDQWTSDDWIGFYITCIHCIDEYLKNSLEPFDDSVLADRQLLAAAGNNVTLLQVVQEFIEEVVMSGGEFTKTQVLETFDREIELEYCKDWKSNWKTRRFKEVAAGLGYQVNPGRLNGRYQQVINGKHEDCFVLVKPMQPGASSDDITPEEPIVEGGRFTGFVFNEDLTMEPVFGTQQHQDLVMEAMEGARYFEKWKCYMSFFFNLKDPDNFPGRIEDEDLEIFQDKLRIAAAKYIQIQLAN